MPKRTFKFDLRVRRISETTAYPSDASFLWTSKPYPLEVVESLRTRHELVGGALMQNLDAIESTHSLLSGQLRSPLQYYTLSTENIDSEHELVGGELRQVLKTYNGWAPEAVNSTHTLTGGVLKLVLLTYANWAPEKLDSTHSLTGGTLS